MIKELHHSAYRCRDSEETRKFYQDFLGLKLVGTIAIKDNPRAPKSNVLHTFFQMDDGSAIHPCRSRSLSACESVFPEFLSAVVLIWLLSS